jgi:hypothetical protein
MPVSKDLNSFVMNGTVNTGYFWISCTNNYRTKMCMIALFISTFLGYSPLPCAVTSMCCNRPESVIAYKL